MSKKVTFENGTRSSTLRFSYRFGSQIIPLETLFPPSENSQSSSFPFSYDDGTNVFIYVEYKLETENQGNETPNACQSTYKDAGVLIDSTKLRENSGIKVVDSEGSPTKKFELQTTPRAVKYELGWLMTLVMTIFSSLKYVYSKSRNRISATQPSVPTAEPPANATEPPVNATEPPTELLNEPLSEPHTEAPANAAGHPVDVTDAGWGQWVPVPVSSAVSSAANYIRGFGTHLYSKNPNESTLPISSRDANFSV